MSAGVEDVPPIASAAALDPTAAPRPSMILDLRELGLRPEPDPEPEPEPEPDAEPAGAAARAAAEASPGAASSADALGLLRDIARRLRTAPDAQETLQFVIDTSCAAIGADAGMLTVSQPEQRQVVHGQALGAGPYISLQLRAGGPTFGEIVLTRMDGAAEFDSQDHTFVDLVAEYVAKAVAGLRRGTVLSGEQQDFIDRITEELRSPMAGAVRLLDTVLSGDAGEISEDQRAYLAAVRADSGRLLTIVEDLVTISALRPPEMRELEPVAVGPWLRRCVEAHRREAEAKAIELILSEPTEPWIVRGVPAQLDNVMRQLLSNALKFTDEGGKVEVSALLAEGLLRIAVSDDGMGFDNGDANRMLDCFSRATNADAARIPGIGVGLFLAAEIAKNHHGRLWLESRRDAGTQAYFGIPLADQGV